jgi:hypothetical protein
MRLSEETTSEILYTYDGEAVGEIPETWSVFKCMGCDSLLLRIVSEAPWQDDPEVSFFPALSKARKEKTYQRLPKNLRMLYQEVIASFNQDLSLLCAAGLRSLVEGICDDKGIIDGINAKGIKTRNLEGRINSLNKFVPPNIVVNLHGFRFLGNNALHRLSKPSKADLHLALNVIEDLLNVVYDLDYHAQRLFKRAAKRARKP